MDGLLEGIYLKAIGEIDPAKDDVPADLGVVDAFTEGSACDKAYEIVYTLKQNNDLPVLVKIMRTRHKALPSF